MVKEEGRTLPPGPPRMGINERDYYRKEGPSFYGSAEDQAKACTWLIGITVALFVAQLLTRTQGPYRFWDSGPLTDSLSLNVPLVLKGQVWRLLTHAFLHSTNGFWHILFNMLALWWFGRQVEERIGTMEFIALYLLAAVFSALAYVATATAGFHPIANPAVGASGAVAAVLMLSALYYPQQVVYVFFVVPVPIWFIILFMIANDGYHLLARVPNGVANSSHLGGLLFGFLYDRLDLKLTGLFTFNLWRARPRLRLYTPEAEEPRRASRLNDEHLEAQMDAILEKVGRVGMDGLTEKERELLMKASEAIRRRDQ
jgi:membrane associated rhomboid family serine protease